MVAAVGLAVLIAGLSGCQSYVRRVDLAEEYFNLGNAFYELEDYERAADYYRRALALEPELAPATFNLGRAYVESEAYEDAIDVLEELAAAEGEPNVLVLESLAYAYFEQGRYEDSAARYGEVISQSPFRVSALYSAALVQRQLENTDRARELLERAWQAQPQDRDILFHYGRVLHETGAGEEAVAILSDYVDSASSDRTDRLVATARIYADERYFARALSVYDAVLAREAQNPRALFGKAALELTAVEAPAEGIENLTAALEAGFDDADWAAELLEAEGVLSRTRATSLLVEAGLIEAEEADEEGDEETDGEEGGAGETDG